MENQFRRKKISERKNYILSIYIIYKKMGKTLAYVEYLLNLISAVAGCISISVFAFLVGICSGITSSTIRFCNKICVFSVEILKKYKPIIRKNKKRMIK